MPLQKQIIDIPFTGGLDSKINPQLLPANKFSLLENCYQEKTGQIRKRNGTTALSPLGMSGDPAIGTPIGLFSRDDELILVDQNHVFSWAPTYERWMLRGGMKSCGLTANEVISGQSFCRMAILGNYACYAHLERTSSFSSFGLTISVDDMASGTRIVSGLDVDPDAWECTPIPLTSVNRFGLVYQEVGSNSLYFKSFGELGSSSPTLSSYSTLAIDSDSLPDFSAVEFDGSNFVVAYTISGTDAKVRKYDSDGSQLATYTITATSTISKVKACVDSVTGDVWVMYKDAGDIKVVRLDSSLALQSNYPKTVYTDAVGVSLVPRSCMVDSSIVLRVVFTEEIISNVPTLAVRTATVEKVSAAIGDSRVVINGLQPCSTLFSYESTTYIAAYETYTHPSVLPTMCLVDIDDGNVISRWFVHQSLSESGRAFDLGGGAFAFLSTRADNLSAFDSNLYDRTFVRIEIDLENTAQPSSVVHDGDLYLTAGMLHIVDRARVQPAGFLAEYPNLPTDLDTNASGGFLTDGTYGLAVAWIRTTSSGNIVRTIPMPLTPQVLSGGTSLQNIEFYNSTSSYNTLVNYRLTSFDDVKIRVYATEVDGSVYYVQEDFINDTSADAQYAEIEEIDTDNAVMYTTGGILAPVLPSTPVAIVHCGDFAVIIPSDKRDTIWVSKPMAEAVAIEFTEDLVYFTPDGGENTAVGYLDGRLIIFKRSQIHEMLGSPPNALGQNGFTGTRMICPDVGCVDQRSIIRVPDGIVFQGLKGFYLLDRNLQVSYVGSPVEDYNDQSVLSALVMEDISQARFCMSGGDVLVWDYFHNNWSVFPDIGAVSSAIWQGKWVYATADGDVCVEDPDTWYDTSSAGVRTAIDYKFRIGWLHASSLQGYQRTRRLALLGQTADDDDHRDKITLTVYTDFDDATASEVILDEENVTNIQADKNSPIRFKCRLSNQKCSSIMVEVLCSAELPDPGAPHIPSATWTALAIEFALKSGLWRLSGDHMQDL